MYKLCTPNVPSNTVSMVLRLIDNAFIPFDPANRDFQEYQEWIALGNQPLPADEQPSS